MAESLPNEAAERRHDPEFVGRQLRKLRTERALSLTEVADATGISNSFLSLVEIGKSDITFGRLVRLLAFYGVTFDEILEEPLTDVVVLPASEVGHVISSGEGIDVLLLAHRRHAPMMPLLAVYEPGGGTSEALPAPSNEFAFVLEGSVEITLEGREPIRLSPGDSAYIASDRPRTYRNTAPKRTRVLYMALSR